MTRHNTLYNTLTSLTLHEPGGRSHVPTFRERLRYIIWIFKTRDKITLFYTGIFHCLILSLSVGATFQRTRCLLSISVQLTGLLTNTSVIPSAAVLDQQFHHNTVKKKKKNKEGWRSRLSNGSHVGHRGSSWMFLRLTIFYEGFLVVKLCELHIVLKSVKEVDPKRILTRILCLTSWK